MLGLVVPNTTGSGAGRLIETLWLTLKINLLYFRMSCELVNTWLKTDTD